MKRNIPVLLAFATLLFSCSSKQTPINELSDLAEEISENGNNYSDEEWSGAMEELNDSLEMTNELKNLFND